MNLESRIIQKINYLTLPAVIISVFVLYIPSLTQWFFTDDFYWINFGKISQNNLQLLLTHQFFNYYRPIVNISFNFDYLFWGLDAYFRHFFNVAIHLFSVILFMNLLLKMKFQPISAAAGALLFGLTPAGCEAVIWISGRTDLLSMLFFLSATVLVIDLDNINRYKTYLAAFLIIMAVFSKESASVWPVVFTVLILMQKGIITTREQLKKAIPLYPVYLAAVLAGLIQVIIQIRSNPYLERFNTGLSLKAWLNNLMEISVFVLISPLEFILTNHQVELVSIVIFIIPGLLLLRYCKSGIWMPVLLILTLGMPTALIPFKFLPEPWLTFRRFLYFPALGSAFIWSMVFQSILNTKQKSIKLVTTAFFIFLLVISYNRTLQIEARWKEITQARFSAVKQIQNVLKTIPPDQDVIILVPEENVWLEMFTLFSNRPVTAVRRLADLSPLNDHSNQCICEFYQGIFRCPVNAGSQETKNSSNSDEGAQKEPS